MKAFVIAGTHSGSGKTTATLGLMRALRELGYRIAPFKAGPDYIDPGLHTVAAGAVSRNLDTWMLSTDTVRELFARAEARADVAVIEGVMGLFDGRSGEDDVGSTAHLAKLLGLPVVLVIDASAMARSAAAMTLGYRQFDPAVEICGVVLNNLGSETHYQMARTAIEAETGTPVLGGLFRDPSLRLPERHLGLIPAVEQPAVEDVVARAAAATRENIDLGQLLDAAAEVAGQTVSEPPVAPVPAAPVPIAIARDEAFSFYYEDGLDILRDAGAELLPFSPLRDGTVPRGSKGIYIGGGFPELFAADLAANGGLLDDIRAHAGAGTPVYAECGGHMYLGQTLTDMEGTAHRMAGVTPVTSTVEDTRLTLGYRVARAKRDGPVFRAGETVRAHEFHLASSPALDSGACWELEEPPVGPAGYADGATWSSYLHVHFGAVPGAAQRFVASCAGVAPP